MQGLLFSSQLERQVECELAWNLFIFCFCDVGGYLFYLVNTGFTITALKQLGDLSETAD
jgi:hypothetical protein